MDGDDDAPIIRAARRGIETTITCVERVDDEHLYRHALLTADVEVPADIAAAVTDAAAAVVDGIPDGHQAGDDADVRWGSDGGLGGAALG